MSALPNSLDCEIRSDGDDDNGGWYDLINDPGTDYSQQASAQKSGADLEIHSSDSTKVRPVAAGVAAADVGNCVNITAGTGFTVDRFIISSQDGTWWTLDSSAGTTSSTGGTYKMGGAIFSIGTFGKHVANYHVAHVKSGTYNLTTTSLNVDGGALSMTRYAAVIGYGSTRNDNGTPPVIVSAGAAHIITLNTSYTIGAQIHNISGDMNGNTSHTCFVATGSYPDNAVFYRCKSEDGNYGFFQGTMFQCYALNAATAFFDGVAHLCEAEGATSYGFSSMKLASHCFANACNYGFITTYNACALSNITAYNCTNHGVRLTGTYQPASINGALLVENGGHGINSGSTSYARALKLSNIITEANTSGDYNGTKAPHHDFTELTGDPFVDKAGGDFRINETAGAGAVVRAAGLGILDQTGHLHVGAIQGADPAGGAGGSVFLGRGIRSGGNL